MFSVLADLAVDEVDRTSCGTERRGFREFRDLNWACKGGGRFFLLFQISQSLSEIAAKASCRPHKRPAWLDEGWTSENE